MTFGRIALLVAASLALLGVDTLIGISGTLYAGCAAGFVVIGFIVAVSLAIAVGHAPLLFLLHNAALGYFLVRNVRMGLLNGLAEFIGIVVAINLLLWLIARARGVPSAAVPARGRGDRDHARIGVPDDRPASVRFQEPIQALALCALLTAPHVSSACGVPALMGIDTLRRQGVQPALLNAIATAQRGATNQVSVR